MSIILNSIRLVLQKFYTSKPVLRDHYTFRAGRNLPDKEFRYIRTIIVTVPVHRGFGCRLPCHQFTNFLDLPALGRRQLYTWSYDFAKTCVFGTYGLIYPDFELLHNLDTREGMNQVAMRLQQDSEAYLIKGFGFGF
ncbi:hypothetical protein Gogos_006072 [Gossypium gossypioides]|uniref:Uncharacterized protein n=1 Tax=Gossypium gossypioides TaxID=34282 RepID=A0A7J9C4M9_GOSGO|nr:hypothetical protein [Gossypium gossypioides]